MIRAAFFFAVALISIAVPLVIAAFGLRGEGKAFSIVAARHWIRSKPTRSVPLITLSVLTFALLWWGVQRYGAALVDGD